MEKKDLCFESDEIHTPENYEEYGPKIELTINSIENVARDEKLSIKFVIEHNGIPLGESSIIGVDSSYERPSAVHSIDFSVDLPYETDDAAIVNQIVTCPVLIKALELVDVKTSIPKVNNKKKLDRKISSSSVNQEMKILGLCNVDLLPIFLGEREIEEKIALETPTYDWDDKAVSWQNLPKLSVKITRDGDELISNKSEFNIMNITVESIYNLPDNFTDKMIYKCGTIAYTRNGVNDTDKSRIIFESGRWTRSSDVDRWKSWRPLRGIESRARESKYKINNDYDMVKNLDCQCQPRFDIKSAKDANVPRIRWNSMERVLLNAQDNEKIKDHIIKFKNWPVEVLVEESDGDDEQEDYFNGNVYQCYVDVSQLLFPGRTQTRVLAQLNCHCIQELKEKTGLDESIFVYDDYEEMIGSGDYVQATSSEPLFTKLGAPVLILIEFELYRPLIPARTLTEYTEAFEVLKNMPKSKKVLYPHTPDTAYDDYMNCIKYLVDVMNEFYQDFLKEIQCKSDEPICHSNSTSKNDCPYFFIPDEMQRFRQYLHEKGKYVAIRNTLKDRIANLIDQKFAHRTSDWFSKQNQNFIAWCYSYLIEQMHIAVNTKLDVRSNLSSMREQDPRLLWYLSEEAYEFDECEKVDKFVSKILYNEPNDPNSWIGNAIFYLRLKYYDEAIECCREAIRLDSRHKIALIFYGILLAARNEYENAEIFLRAVTQLHPRCSEGWAVLHLFYIKIQYHPGIDLTLEFAEKSLLDRSWHEPTLLGMFEEEPIAWSTMLCRNNRIFLMTASLLLRLHLYDFVGIALAQDVCHNGKSVSSLYFLSANCYLQGFYEDALKYLRDAELIIGFEYCVIALQGHCHYKMNDAEKAMDYYRTADKLHDRPDDVHLIHLRMGQRYVDEIKYGEARSVFLRACKFSATCKTWLGVGVSCYYMGKFDECELALTEANRIDGEEPEVWAYLCLLNLSLKRYDEFCQCYRLMVKNKLENERLYQTVINTMQDVGYEEPVIEFSNVKSCGC